jgi:tRNA nucleotidyltransferase (CCA-adding enzyme)
VPRPAVPRRSCLGYHDCMQVYLVGGAVRDELLGRAVHERDWVVVGATPEQMIAQGYKPVGRDFPVFLHPTTNEEYALARLERKIGPGYRGFTTQHSPEVTLEQDLRRRDLTVNAIARAADGTLVDPHGGQQDLRARVLRHVSPAFSEDPVRILRVARFAARFAPLGFTVAPETMALMRGMVATGEADALVGERVWRELERALGEPAPGRCFEVLADCGALAVLAPGLAAALATAPAPLAALARAVAAGLAPAERWAALLASVGEAQAESLCRRLHATNEFRELAMLAARLHTALAAAGGATAASGAGALAPEAALTLIERGDALRRPGRFAAALRAVAQSLEPAAAAAHGALAQLRAGLARVAAVQLPAAEMAAMQGPAIATRLRALRLAALTAG